MDFDRCIIPICLLLAVLQAFLLVFKLTQPSNEEFIKNGKYWSTDCTLKEVNVPTGFFSSDINRLDCSGIIVNVATDKYNRAISAYNKSEQ